MNPSTRNILLLAAALAFCTIALFAPALQFGFTGFDDVQYTVETPTVVSGLSLPNIRWAFTTIHESWYSPLLWISYMADSSLFGPRASAYHLTNVLLHAANALLLFGILLRLTRALLASFFAAALWALHPLRVESVVWITERKDVLSGLFFLLAVVAYLAYVARPSRARAAGVALAMAAGLLSKTILVVLPPLLLVLDAWPLRRRPLPASFRDLRTWRPLLAEKFSLFLLMAAGIVLTLYTHRHAHDNAPPLSLFYRLALIAPSILGHLRQILWPAHLALFYPVSYPSLAVCALAFLAVLGLSMAAARFRQACPAFLAAWLWFLIALAPVLRGIRLDEQSATPDRYSYLAAMGFSFLAGRLFQAFAASSRRRLAFASLAAIALLTSAAIRTRLYLPLWQDQSVLAPALLQTLPDHPLVNNAVGQILAARGQPDLAIPFFEKAAAWNTQASCNLATALLHAGRPAEALPAARRASTHPHAPPEAFLLLGLCHLQLDQAPAAIPLLEQTAALMPANPLAWQLLFRAHLEAGQSAQARLSLARWRGIHPFQQDGLDELIAVYARTWQAGNPRLAWPFFANNVPRFPDHVPLLNAAAWLLATTEPPPAPPAEALRLARKALAAAGQDHPALLDTLAASHAANGDFESAVRTATDALAAIAPFSPESPLRREDIERRLAQYRQRQPYRESPK